MTTEKENIIEETLDALRRAWPSPVITRGQVEKFTGGALTGKTMANLDSRGEGPPGRIKMGRQTVYRMNEFLVWLRGRCS